MVRRSFRFGLRLGLLFGATFALVKTVQSRRAASGGPAGPASPPPAPWKPITDDPPKRAETPPPSDATSSPRATSSIDEPVDEVGEPILEFEPETEPPVAAVSESSVDPRLDIVPGSAEPPAKASDPAPAKMATPRKTAAKKQGAGADAAPAGARPTPPRRAARKAAAASAQPKWVEADGGVCPPTHPVKVKLKSKLFHLPGMFAYARTQADRCYTDGQSATADGFTSAKR